MPTFSRLLAIMALSAALPACTVGPNFKTPRTNVEPAFDDLGGTSGSRTVSSAAPIAEWWHTFNDPELDHLVDVALHENLDLQIATARIREARAQRNIAAGELFPEVDASAGYNHARGSKNVSIPLGGLSGNSGNSGAGSGHSPNSAGKNVQQQTVQGGSSASGLPSGAAPPLSPFGEGGLPGVSTSLYQAGFDANWELDIFGGHRRELEAAAADLAAAAENRRGVAITLLAEVARNYLELREAQQRLVVANANLAAQKEILELTQARRKQGFTSDLDVTRAAGAVATTASTIPPLEAQTRRSLHALSTLLAKNPSDLTGELHAVKPLPTLPPQVPVGLPSDLLLRRPDIRRAQAQIHAANARIGSATADLFPKFALTGSVGLDASKISQLFSWDSRYFLISPTVTWPIFDAGRIASNISLQKASTQEAVLQYRKVVFTALQEVQDALAQYATEQVRNASLVEALQQNQQALTIARMQYKQGLVNFLDVLEAQRSVLATQDAVVQSRALMATNLVALYKALGGGWQTTEKDEPGAPRGNAVVDSPTAANPLAGNRTQTTGLPSGAPAITTPQ